MMTIPDAYDLWEQREQEQQQELDSLPKCDHCDNPIQDEELCDFDGFLICPKCLRNHYMKPVEDYME